MDMALKWRGVARRSNQPGLRRSRRRWAVAAAVVVGLLFGFVATALAFQTYYVGSSGSNGTIPKQGNGASTAGVAARIDNRAQALANCTAGGGSFKAYYVLSDGNTIFGSQTCIVGQSFAQIGSSGGTSVYSRCSTSGNYTVPGKCFTDW